MNAWASHQASCLVLRQMFFSFFTLLNDGAAIAVE
jgi:hypothetical protein